METNKEKGVKSKFKIYNVIILIIMISVIIIELAIPIINNHSIKPRRFKKTIYEGLRNNPVYNSISDDILLKTTNCICEDFNYLHGVGNYPKEEIYTKQDVKIIFSCYAEFLLKGDEQKFFYEHMDSLVNAYFVPSTP